MEQQRIGGHEVGVVPIQRDVRHLIRWVVPRVAPVMSGPRDGRFAFGRASGRCQCPVLMNAVAGERVNGHRGVRLVGRDLQPGTILILVRPHAFSKAADRVVRVDLQALGRGSHRTADPVALRILDSRTDGAVARGLQDAIDIVALGLKT